MPKKKSPGNKTERHQVRTTLAQRREFEEKAAARARATCQECTVGNYLVLAGLACDVADDGSVVAVKL